MIAREGMIDDLIDMLAERVAEKLRARQANDEFVDQRSVPGLTRRAYLEAARAGAFKSSKVGRRVIAKRAEVIAWIESKARGPVGAPAPAVAVDELDEEREALGLKPRARGAA